MAEAHLPGLASSVPPARRFAESVLAGWGLPNGGWTAAQIVSELATNCALHARTPFRLRIQVTDTGIRLEVHDDAPSSLHVRDFGTTSTTGRGLRMVEILSEAWGVEPAGTGKTVWAQLPGDDAPDGSLDRVR